MTFFKELKIAEDRVEKRQNLFEEKILELEENRKVLSKERDNIEEAKDIKEFYDEIKYKLNKILGDIK